MTRIARAIIDGLRPEVDSHRASFLGREVGGLPGPVWSLVAWNTVMALVTVLNVLALGLSHDLTVLRVAVAGYWVATALAVRLLGVRTPTWVLHLLLDLNIVVISVTAATALTDARAAGSLVFLVLPAVYAATWMDRQRLGAHLLLLLVASGAVVIVRGENADLTRAWIALVAVTIGLAYFVNALVRHLSQQAVLDPLTGLLNRAGLEMVLAAQERPGQPQSRVLAVLDLDGFKQVNDTLGHAGGDDVLREVGSVLRSGVRPNDSVVRTGGDEFLIVLTRTTVIQAREVVGRVVGRLPIGCSVGIVEWARDESLDDALRRADREMYQDKATRRGAGSGPGG